MSCCDIHWCTLLMCPLPRCSDSWSIDGLTAMSLPSLPWIMLCCNTKHCVLPRTSSASTRGSAVAIPLRQVGTRHASPVLRGRALCEGMSRESTKGLLHHSHPRASPTLRQQGHLRGAAYASAADASANSEALFFN